MRKYAATTQPPLSAHRISVIARHELRLLRHDPAPLAVLVVLPLILAALLKPAYARAGLVPRADDPNGSGQAVPAMAVTFAFNLVGVVGFSFLRDHAWGTWDRLRSSPASGAELLLGKTTASLAQAGLQFAALFGLGALVFGLKVRGSVFALALVGSTFAACLVAVGFVLAAYCRTFGQVYAITNVIGLIMAGLGGAIVPASMLPEWTRALARVDPAYWAMKAYREIILAGGGVARILPTILILSGFVFVLLGVASRRFRFGEAKA
jgi:ABC-2 type transport system permease protein